jgi:hypothetical protein
MNRIRLIAAKVVLSGCEGTVPGKVHKWESELSATALWLPSGIPTLRSRLTLSHAMEKIELAQLPLLDLAGKRYNLAGQFDEYLLLIFLRHLA